MAHSDVFRAMFSHKETVENTQSRLKIADFDSEVVGQMLKYLYTGELTEELATEDFVELLKIAEKYQLELLKSDCEGKLILRFVVCSIINIERDEEITVFDR